MEIIIILLLLFIASQMVSLVQPTRDLGNGVYEVRGDDGLKTLNALLKEKGLKIKSITPGKVKPLGRIERYIISTE